MQDAVLIRASSREIVQFVERQHCARKRNSLEKPQIFEGFSVGDIGLENPSETREFCGNCHLVTPNPTPMNQGASQFPQNTTAIGNKTTTPAVGCDATRENAISFIASRWNSTPCHIRQAILTLIQNTS